MRNLDAVAVFVKVAQAGSFSRAAEQLGMPNSTVSTQVSRLEQQLGVTLLQRTTRRLRLTEAGENYFRLTSQAVDEIASAEAQMGAAQSQPQGYLRITAAADMVTNSFSEMIAEFRKKYPKVDIEFVFTDRVLDMLAERIDIAFRASHLRDSRLIARRVGLSYWMLFASPSYLRQAGTPDHPRKLRDHSLLQFTELGRDHWRLSRGSTVVAVPLPHNVLANDATVVRRLAVAGNGIALLPINVCREDVREGRLVRVLREWAGKTYPVHIIYVRQKFVPAKVRAFVDYAAQSLQPVFSPPDD